MTKPAENSITIGDFLSFLDGEIDKLIQREKQPGWTLWAILVALSGLAWVALGEVEKKGFQIGATAKLFVAMTAATDAIRGIISILAEPQEKSIEGSRFQLARQIIGQQRVALFAGTMYAATVALVARHWAEAVQMPYVYLGVGLYGVLALLSLVLLLPLSFFRIPFTRFENKKSVSAYIGTAAFSLGLGFVAIGYAIPFIRSPVRAAVGNVRIAGLLVVAWILILQLSRYADAAPLLPSLVEIRQDLGLGRVTLEEAIRRADIALLGLKVADVLQRDVRRVFDIWEQMGSYLREARRKIESLEASLTQPAQSERKKPSELINTVFQALQGDMEKLNEKRSELKRTVLRLMKSIKWMKRISKESGPDISSLEAKLESEAKRFAEEAEEFFKRVEKFAGKNGKNGQAKDDAKES